MKKSSEKLIILMVSIPVILLGWYFGEDYLTLEGVQGKLELFEEKFNSNPIIVSLVFVGLYTAIVAFFLPGSLILNLLAGAVVGAVGGIMLATVSTTIGSVVSFYLSRYVASDWVEERFPKKSKQFNNLLADGGWINIFLLRLVPAFPVGATNFLAGITDIKTYQFATATMLGVIPWIAFYVLAGEKLSSIDSVDEIWSAELAILAFGFVSLMLGGKLLMRKMSLNSPQHTPS